MNNDFTFIIAIRYLPMINNRFRLLFCAFRDRGQHLYQFLLIRKDTPTFTIEKIIRLMQNIDPITGFIDFFERYLHFRHKTGLALRINRFRNIRPDARTAAQQLFGQNILLPFLPQKTHIFTIRTEKALLLSATVFRDSSLFILHY